MERAVFDRMAEIDQDHWWFCARRAIITQLIDQYRPCPKAMNILEVGCGTGSNLSLLQRYGTVDAVEPDDIARDHASRSSGIKVKGGYLPDGVELEDGRYDLIVMFDVLEHIPDDRGALALLHRKLAPGGRMLVTVPAIPWLWSAHDVAHHHQRRYTRDGLLEVFRQTHFTPIHHSHFNSLLLPPIIAARSLGKLLGREGGDDAIPAAPVNAMLKGVFGLERHWVTHVSVPFGVSLALVAEAETTGVQ